MEVQHLPKEPRYPCQACGLKFVTRRRLARHRSKECRGPGERLIRVDAFGHGAPSNSSLLDGAPVAPKFLGHAKL